MRWTAFCCCTTTTASWSGPATPISMSSCRFSGCSWAWPAAPPSLPGPTCGCAHTGCRSPPRRWCSACSFVFAVLVPDVFERFYVKPSELQLERPYIQRNIALTREAYGLQHIEVKPFPAEQGLTFQSLADDRGTVEQHPAVGLAAADGHLRATAGDPHLLQVPQRRGGSLPDRRFLSAGDDRGAASLRPRCWRRMPRPGSTCICCSPTATAWSCRR